MRAFFPFIVVLIFGLSSCGGSGQQVALGKKQGCFIRDCKPSTVWENGLIRIDDSTLVYLTTVSAQAIGLLIPGKPIFIHAPKDSLEFSGNQLFVWDSICGISSRVFRRDVFISQVKYEKFQFVWGWIQFWVSSCTVFIIIAVWISYVKKNKQNQEARNDFGVFLISAALMLWASIGLIEIYSEGDKSRAISVHVISMVNNLFFMLSVPFFNHGINLFKRNKLFFGIGSITLFLLAFFIILYDFNARNEPTTLSDWTDGIYSGITLILLGYVLHKSFSSRGFKSVSKLVVVWFLGAIYSQIVPYIDGALYLSGYFYNIVYCTSFIVILSVLTALMFSWYNEQREFSIRNEFNTARDYLLSNAENVNLKYDFILSIFSSDDLSLVFNLLLEEFRPFPDLHKELVHTSARFYNNEKQYRLGIILHDQYQSEKSKISAALLDLLEIWKHKLIKK